MSSFFISFLTISFRECCCPALEVYCMRKQQKLPPSWKCCILLVWTSCSLDSGGYGLIWQPPPGRRVKSAVPGTGVGKFLQFICQPRPSPASPRVQMATTSRWWGTILWSMLHNVFKSAWLALSHWRVGSFKKVLVAFSEYCAISLHFDVKFIRHY